MKIRWGLCWRLLFLGIILITAINDFYFQKTGNYLRDVVLLLYAVGSMAFEKVEKNNHKVGIIIDVFLLALLIVGTLLVVNN